MIPLPDFKRILGSTANNLSDKQIEAIRDAQDRLADIFFDSWLRERNMTKLQSSYNGTV